MEFTHHLGIRSTLRIDTSLINVPEHPGYYMPDTFLHKSFSASKTIPSLDMGVRWPESRFSTDYRQTCLVWLHEQDGSFTKAKRRAPEAEETHRPSDRATLTYYAMAGFPSAHLVPLLLMDEAQYMRATTRSCGSSLTRKRSCRRQEPAIRSDRTDRSTWTWIPSSRNTRN